jgi:hypothetical protein
MNEKMPGVNRTRWRLAVPTRQRAIDAPRRGAILLEVAVAATLLCSLLVLAAQTLAWTGRARRTIDERAVALTEAANLLDEFTAWPWTDLTVDRLGASKLSPATVESLPAARLKVTLDESPVDELPQSKRVTVAITWHDHSGLDRAPARLTAWVYRAPESKTEEEK